MSDNLVDIYKLFLHVCHKWIYDERLAKNFCHHENSKIWKISCYRPLRYQRKNFINWKLFVKQTLLTNKECMLTFVMFDINRKNGAKSFPHWKVCFFFFKKMCFQQPLSSWRNDLSFSSVTVRLAFGLIEIVPWGFSNSKTRWKTGQKLFSLENLTFKKLCFQQPLKSWRKDLRFPKVIVTLASELL